MYHLKLDWKEFNVSLPMINAKMKNEFGAIGTSGNAKLEIHFEETPSQETLDAIHAFWEALDEESDEAESYAPALTEAQMLEKQELTKQAKLAMIEKTWATMNALERKLCIGLEDEVSLEELQAHLAE